MKQEKAAIPETSIAMPSILKRTREVMESVLSHSNESTKRVNEIPHTGKLKDVKKAAVVAATPPPTATATTTSFTTTTTTTTQIPTPSTSLLPKSSVKKEPSWIQEGLTSVHS